MYPLINANDQNGVSNGGFHWFSGFPTKTKPNNNIARNNPKSFRFEVNPFLASASLVMGPLWPIQNVGTGYAVETRVSPFVGHQVTFYYQCNSQCDTMWHSKMPQFWASFDQDFCILICCCPYFPS